MKYKLQDFEEMVFTKRKYGGATGKPAAKLRMYKGKFYLSMNRTLLEELNFSTDGDGKLDFATANYPEKCIQFVVNPINKNIQTYKLKATTALKLTNDVLFNQFLFENGINNGHQEDIALNYEITFKQGKMMALEFTHNKD